MSNLVELTIPGDPIPWGPKQVTKKGNRFVPARQSAAISDITALILRKDLAPFEVGESLEIDVVFYIARPKSHFGTGRNSSQLKPSAPQMPLGKPDLSNLVKLVEDALVIGGLIPDDDQVVAIRAEKFWTLRTPYTELMVSVLPALAPAVKAAA